MIEYKLRPVTRYIVTRYEGSDNPNVARAGACTIHGEFDNERIAYEVGYALAKADADRLGLPPGDMTVIFPASLAEATHSPGGLLGNHAGQADRLVGNSARQLDQGQIANANALLSGR